MSTCVQLQFNLNPDAALGDLEAEIDRNPDFECVVIQNVPTFQLGLEFILNDWFKPGICDLPNVFGIILKINAGISEKFNDGPRSFEFRNKPSFLVAFESTVGNHETIIFWKAPGNDEFYSICTDGNVTTVLCDFLIQEIKAGRSGIIRLPNSRKKIRLHEIRGSQENDLLAIAVNNDQTEVVRSLLGHDFVADKVINLAWELYLASNNNERLIRNQIILCLLAANSKLPDNFVFDKASPEVQGFINWCEDLQKDVDSEDLTLLKTRLDSLPNLFYFYDRNNQSLLAFAIKSNKTKVFKTFARRLNTGSHEYLQNIYQTIQNTDKRLMRKKREQNPFMFPKTHLLVLKSKTRISSNDQNAQKHWEYIEEAYETIDSIEYCSIILQVAAECKSVQIFFDFKHDSTYYMDPATSVYSKGIIYEGGIIYIGAKDLLNEATKFNVIGVIAHELCHLAVYIGFMNRNFYPFPTGEGELKRRFIEKVMVQCKQNEEFEQIIRNVFRSYPKDVQDSEMIVTYPQILMKYFGNAAKIEQLEGIFDELVKYSKEVVEPELDRALNVLKLLNDENYRIKFNNLTEPMKARILHSKTHFQGVETTLFEMVGTDQEMLKDLTSEHIRNILLKNQTIQIGEAVKLEMKYEIIPRNFEKILAENQVGESENAPSSSKKRKLKKPETETKTFEQARNETNCFKVFLLADHAGSGKTTIFKDCSKKLKEFYRNSWVSFVNLRKHGKIFDQKKEKTDTLALDDVCQILLKIINPNQGLETSIFNNFFKTGQTIFLFDGVDEISPIYTELLMKIFAILCQMKVKNQMWISTRPHYAQKLSDVLKIPYHKFTQYKPSEINEFIKEILKCNENKEEKEYLLKINKCMKGLKGFYYESKEIENPLMVQMVTELYIEKKVDPDNISRYGVYEAMVEKQKDKVGEKIPNSDRDKDFNLNIWDVHRVLALISIVGDEYKQELKFKLEDLQIMQKWKEEKHKWTSDMIQRYGFVIVDLSSENVDRSSIDFMHRTYAEFFVVQIFSRVIINDNNNIYSDPKILDIFSVLMKRKNKFHVVEDFALSLVKDKVSRMEKLDVMKVRVMYSKDIQKIHKMEFGNDFCSKLQNWIEKYGQIVNSFDIKTLEKLWKLDEENNLLEEYFKSNNMAYNKKITKCAEMCFGSCWHEKFNKSGTKLITDDEILKFKHQCKSDSECNDLKIFLKFSDLLDKNFKIDYKKKFYAENNFTFRYTFNYIECQKEIFSRARRSFDRIEFCETFFLNANLNYTSYEKLHYILYIIDNDFINDKDSLRKLLFQSTERTKSPICPDFGFFEDKEKFMLIKDFYTKHKNSWNDIQDILVDIDPRDFINQVQGLYYSEFKELVKYAFGTDFSKLVTKFENFDGNIRIFMWYSNNLKDLLNLIFSNDKEKVTNIIAKLT